MTDLVAGPPKAPRGVERAVDREMRSYVLQTIFLASLAVVPFVCAAYFYTSGRTDRQLVSDEVRKGVAPVEAIARQVEPLLAQAQTTAREVAQQQQRVATLVKEQEQVRERVTQLSERFPQVEASATRAQELSAALTELRSNLENQNQRLAAVAEAQTRLSQEQTRIDNDVRGLSARITQLPHARLEELLLRFNEIDGQIKSMDRRLNERIVPR